MNAERTTFVIAHHAILAIAMAAVLLLLGQSSANELFVCRSTGDDNAAGTSRDAPLRTVQAAVERAEPGTTITLLPGWHEGGIELKPGEPGRPITLRGERKGRVFVGRPASAISGWERAQGFAYTHVASVSSEPRTLMETSTGKQLRPMPSALDVEHLAGTFHYDAEAETLHLHPSDSESALRHFYTVPPAQGVGVVLADHTVVEDLVFTGLGEAAVRGDNPTGATVRDCVAYGNGYAVELRGGADCRITGNHFWANVPGYAAGSQIYVGRPRSGPEGVRGIVIEGNRVYGSSKSAIRFYSVGAVEDCAMRGNLMEGSHSKGVGSEGLTGDRNVGITTFWAHHGGHNTYRVSPRANYIKDTDLVIDRRDDWHFADPAYHDYRLQSDSPARGAAPDGSDLGAFQYGGSVGYVSPDGDDAAEGTSVRSAWRTLAHATRALRPGQTLYVEPGEWAEPLVLEGLKADAAEPTRVRVRGKERASFPSILVRECANIVLEDLATDSSHSGIRVVDSEDAKLARCASAGGEGHGISVARSSGITLEHCGVSGHAGGGVLVQDSTDVEVVSSVLAVNGGPQIELRGETTGFWSEFNAFVSEKGLTGRAGGQDAKTMEDWREMTGGDAESFSADPADFAALGHGDFRAAIGRPPAFSGRYSKPVGPHGATEPPAPERDPVERVEVVSTTRTSANIAYWTPGRITGTMIEWGRTPEYDERYDRAGRSRGEYETFHTVSLLGLEPETTYHFRVGFRDHVTEDDYDDGESAIIAASTDPPLVWSEDLTFTTAAKDPEPRQLYVSLDGDDANDGLSPETAWRTLHKAGREARAGDTVIIAPGRYLELLRPLQTGTGPNRRIVFRAEKPLTVFLGGGFTRDGTGRSHAAQLLSKSFVSLEKLAFEGTRLHDNGGYRGWPGYAGLVRVSGSTGIRMDACVMDGRRRYMVGLQAEAVGAMPGSPEEVSPLTVTDSVFLFNWYSVFVSGRGQAVMRNNSFSRSLLLKAVFQTDTVLRNNVYESLQPGKKGSQLFIGHDRMNSDYNCFSWDPENDVRNVSWLTRRREKAAHGLAEWQEIFDQDTNSIEAHPGSGLSEIAGIGRGGKVARGQRLKIEDMLLPPDSPCQGAGEDGEDIGPRWERFLAN